VSTRAVAPTVAAAVPVLAPVQRPMLQRSCDCGQHTGGGECEDCKKKKQVPLQRHANGFATPPVAPAIVHEVLRSPGQALDSATLAFMEPRFRQDFSEVRVHIDERSAESARAVSAHAYTVGRHVVFGSGRYAPQTTSGRSLLSHELTHVVQQSATSDVAGEPRIGEVQDAAEREAAQAETIQPGQSTPIATKAAPRVQGKWSWENAGWGTLIGGAIGGVAGGIAGASGASLGASLALLGGGALAGFVIGGLTGKDKKAEPESDDPAKIANPPACGSKQLAIIVQAIKQGAEWVGKALTSLVAYKSAPKDPANKAVHDRLMERFHSDTGETVGRVERVLSLLNSRFSSPKFESECHAAKDLCAPPFAAYVPDPGHVVFCPSFFKPGLPVASMLIHEMSHSLVGGAPIGDRGYQGERIFKRLSTDEALTNAESYAEFIVDVASGTPVPSAAPEDNVKTDCPADWQEPIRDAIAKAERWNTNAINLAADPDNAKYWGIVAAKHLPPTFPLNVNFAVSTASMDLERALRVYRTTDDKLHTAIHFACQPSGGSPCDKGGAVAWLGPSSNFFLCADWHSKNATDQVVSMLAGLYGYLAGLDDPAWRTGLARIAFEITQDAFKAPSHADVVGNPTWSKDQIRIEFVPKTPKSPSKYAYEESGTKHERFSADQPSYEGPDCQASNLPFNFSAYFSVDSMGNERPGPYPAPRVAMDYALEAPGSDVHTTQSDPATLPQGGGYGLKTRLKFPVDVSLKQNGPFHIKLTLEDPETGVVRTYEDVIQVSAVRPCDVPEKGPKQTPGQDKPGIDPRKQKRESRVT